MKFFRKRKAGRLPPRSPVMVNAGPELAEANVQHIIKFDFS